MKKIFLSIFVAGALAFGLQSCGSDCDDVTCPAGQTCVDGECVDDGVQATCDACGDYSGTFSSDGDSITILLGPAANPIGIDSILEPTPFSVDVTEGAAAGELDMDVTLQVTVAGAAVPIPVGVTVDYNATTGAFTAAEPNKDYTLTAAGIPVKAKLVNMSGTIVNGTANGSIILTDHTDDTGAGRIDATLIFTATKQ